MISTKHKEHKKTSVKYSSKFFFLTMYISCSWQALMLLMLTNNSGEDISNLGNENETVWLLSFFLLETNSISPESQTSQILLSL